MQPMDRIQAPQEKQFLEGLTQGQLLIPVCSACHQKHWYPRPVCPFCGQPVHQWEASEGYGEVYALTLLHAKDKPAQCIAYIKLDDRVTILATLWGDQITRACIGRKVKFAVASSMEKTAAVFTLLSDEELNRDD